MLYGIKLCRRKKNVTKYIFFDECWHLAHQATSNPVKLQILANVIYNKQDFCDRLTLNATGVRRSSFKGFIILFKGWRMGKSHYMRFEYNLTNFQVHRNLEKSATKCPKATLSTEVFARMRVWCIFASTGSFLRSKLLFRDNTYVR